MLVSYRMFFCKKLMHTKEVLVRRNDNFSAQTFTQASTVCVVAQQGSSSKKELHFSAQAETYEFSVRCRVTNLIFE